MVVSCAAQQSECRGWQLPRRVKLGVDAWRDASDAWRGDGDAWCGDGNAAWRHSPPPKGTTLGIYIWRVVSVGFARDASSYHALPYAARW